MRELRTLPSAAVVTVPTRRSVLLPRTCRRMVTLAPARGSPSLVRRSLPTSVAGRPASTVAGGAVSVRVVCARGSGATVRIAGVALGVPSASVAQTE